MHRHTRIGSQVRIEHRQSVWHAQWLPPTVTLKSKQLDGIVVISLGDIGIGIREDFVDKIFKPFFTTKPAGEGTGLGLSLSYDIITKGHGGELKVDTTADQGTTFTIILPV